MSVSTVDALWPFKYELVRQLRWPPLKYLQVFTGTKVPVFLFRY